MRLQQDSRVKEKIDKIKQADIQLYLDMWGYSGIDFCGTDPSVLELSRIWGCPETGCEKDKGNVLKVTGQDENRLLDSPRNSYGVGQLLYELEVFADMPPEIRGSVSEEGWLEFIVRFITRYKRKGWNVSCTMKMPLTERMEGRTGEKIVLEDWKGEKDRYGKHMILQNGNGGRACAYYEQYKDKKRVEIVRIIVLFRAYIAELLCNHFKERLKQNQVELFVVNWEWALDNPLHPKQKITSSDLEKRKKYTISQIVNNEGAYKGFLAQIYGGQANLKYIREVMNIPNRLKMGIGNVVHENRHGKYLNVLHGERKTKYQPPEYGNTVYLLGGCVFFGYAVEDKQTVASYLQKKLNEKVPGRKWRVVNYGTWGGDIDWTYQRLYQIRFQPGDMVLVSYAGLMPIGPRPEERDISRFLKQADMSQVRYFNTIIHCNKSGYKKTADGIFEMFRDYFTQDAKAGEAFWLDNEPGQNKMYQKQAEEYIRRIKGQLPPCMGKIVGAIVMNCNPFTLGHQYLIEYAAGQVDILIVFVVEEDRSYFPFEDRIRLVRQGTAHMGNVWVVPSGKLIISTATFPAYFLKDMPDSVGVDTSLDVSIFGGYIAEAFHITVRFAGEEPFDIVTRNYNESMKRILPLYGVRFVVVERRKFADMEISASRVRKLLKENKLSEVQNLVPESTFCYLAERYGSDG